MTTTYTLPTTHPLLCLHCHRAAPEPGELYCHVCTVVVGETMEAEAEEPCTCSDYRAATEYVCPRCRALPVPGAVYGCPRDTAGEVFGDPFAGFAQREAL